MLGSAVPRGQQMVTAVSSVTLSPSPLMLSWQHCAICEPPHLSQLHPVAAVHVCLCTDPRGHRRPHGVQGPVLLPQHSGWDSHSAICISEKQLECILKTQGWIFSFLWCAGRSCCAGLPPFLFFFHGS